MRLLLRKQRACEEQAQVSVVSGGCRRGGSGGMRDTLLVYIADGRGGVVLRRGANRGTNDVFHRLFPGGRRRCGRQSARNNRRVLRGLRVQLLDILTNSLRAFFLQQLLLLRLALLCSRRQLRAND